MIYKICAAEAWRLAEQQGKFLGASIDLADGYIHFSAAEQVRETAEKHFSGQTDLVLVQVDDKLLREKLKWEASRGGQLFPHLYDALPMSAVVRVDPLPWGDQDGCHVFPEYLGATG